jgi:hypothetical protein
LRGPALASAHRDLMNLAKASGAVSVRLALSPLIVKLDEMLLASLPEAGRRFASAKETKQHRLHAAAELDQALGQLGQRPAPVDALPALAPALGFPRPGLPSSLAFSGMAVRGHLQGPLPPPRLLTLYAVRPAVHAMYHGESDADLQTAAARVLGRMHLVMHGIFKPDENARDVAVQRYRARYPAAARASQSIIIYDVTPVGPCNVTARH